MDFKDRERGEEAKFAFDEENAFKIAARRNRLLGEWAAGLMNLSEEETDAYKKAVVQADFEEAGDEDVVRKLLGDLTAADCDVSEADIRAKLSECSVEARRQFMGEARERLIREGLPDAEVTIRDLAGDGDHYAAHVVSAAFAGKSRVQQHKLVYEALGTRMGGELHALQLTTQAPTS